MLSELALQLGYTHVVPNALCGTAAHTEWYVFRATERRLGRIIAALLPHLEWRHHGIGVLQAYIHEAEPELRVHIWDPALLVAGMEDSGQIHDHRFDLESKVLVGRIYHEEFKLTPARGVVGACQIYNVVNARKVIRDRVPGDLELQDGVYTAERQVHCFAAGTDYFFPRRQFHRSLVNELAVSLVTKHQQEDVPARILAPYGTTPIHAFQAPGLLRDKVQFQPYIDRAVEQLSAT